MITQNEVKLADCWYVARLLGVEPEVILAVARVESNNNLNGYLFEPHIFSRLTKRKYDKTHPHLSWPKWDRTKYPKTQALRDKQFDEAVRLNVFKAYESASWGLFQIMGFHFKILKYTSALSMATNLRSGIEPNVTAFGRIVQDMKLIPALKDKDWAKFARRYNGPGYKLNDYDTKMQLAYAEIPKNWIA